MTATELAVYAAERALMIRGLVVLAIMGFASGLFFAAIYGMVRPQLKRYYRRAKSLAAQVAGLKGEHVALTLQNESLTRQLQAAEKATFDAQMARAAAELESRRNLTIRQKTEDALIKYRKETGR